MRIFASNSLVELELYTDEAIRHICFLAQNGRIAMGCSIYTTSHDKSTNQNYLNSVELAEQFGAADYKEAKLVYRRELFGSSGDDDVPGEIDSNHLTG